VNSKWIFGLYVMLVMVQLAVPASQIWRYEDILQTGHVYKFRTAPIDPYDAFRGRYVFLSFADTEAPIRPGDKLAGGPVYVELAEGEDGFAQFKQVSLEPPASGDYAQVDFHWEEGKDRNRCHFRMPFDRFFMEESAAPKAEEAYRDFGNRRGETQGDAYALVHVKRGIGVIEDVYIKNQPIREFIKTIPQIANP
jgi:GDYXXLXY protein